MLSSGDMRRWRDPQSSREPEGLEKPGAIRPFYGRMQLSGRRAIVPHPGSKLYIGESCGLMRIPRCGGGDYTATRFLKGVQGPGFTCRQLRADRTLRHPDSNSTSPYSTSSASVGFPPAERPRELTRVIFLPRELKYSVDYGVLSAFISEVFVAHLRARAVLSTRLWILEMTRANFPQLHHGPSLRVLSRHLGSQCHCYSSPVAMERKRHLTIRTMAQ